MAAITLDAVQFQLLDPGIVSVEIPAFFIGRNKEGFWVARDVNGQIDGISCSKIPRFRLPEGIAGSRAARRFFLPSPSNSTWKTTAIRSPGTWDH